MAIQPGECIRIEHGGTYPCRSEVIVTRGEIERLRAENNALWLALDMQQTRALDDTLVIAQMLKEIR